MSDHDHTPGASAAPDDRLFAGTSVVPPAEGEIRTFGQFVASLEDGDLHHDLTEALARINQALSDHVLEHGGKPAARLDLAIEVTLDDGIFTVRPKLKLKLPDGPRRKTVLFGTDGGRFSRQNPRQAGLFDRPRPARTA